MSCGSLFDKTFENSFLFSAINSTFLEYWKWKNRNALNHVLNSMKWMSFFSLSLIYLVCTFNDADWHASQFSSIKTVRFGTSTIRIFVQKCNRFLCGIIIVSFRFNHTRHVTKCDALIIMEIVHQIVIVSRKQCATFQIGQKIHNSSCNCCTIIRSRTTTLAI